MDRLNGKDTGATQGLSVEDLAVEFEDAGGRTTAVDGVSLDVAPGEVVALLGPSGCGKSSLLRAVAGLEPPARGRIRWAGADLAGVPVHRRGFGLMFQDGQLFAHRDVAGNVEYGLQIQRVPRAARRERVAELLDVVGLPGSQRRSVATMSGGERQRVALARALAPRPQLLLLDEPLSALDRALRERLAADLRAALLATGTTALFVTHDHDEAFTVADRVAVMSRGRLLQVATPDELWAAPADREVAEFLGYQAFLPDDGDGLRAVAPRGLRVVGPRSDTADTADGADGADGSDGTFHGTVVSTVLRRGVREVAVQVDLGEGPVRVTATAEDGSASWEPGDGVGLELDDARTTRVAGVRRVEPAP